MADLADPIETHWTSWLGGALKRVYRLPFRLVRYAQTSAIPVSTRLTREGLQFVFMVSFILIGAVLRGVNNLLVILAGVLLGMLFLQWRVCAKTLNGLSVERRLPRSIHARRGFEIELVLLNPKTWLGSWLVLVQDRLVYSPEHTTIERASQAIGLLFMSVPPMSSRTQRYRCLAQRRGRYQFMGIELTTRFPLGLMRGILASKPGESFIVQPALGRLLPAWFELFNTRSSGVRHRRVRSLSDEGEFFGLRSYRPGDSPRWIHWRSSARRDELVVKQFQQPESREIIVLLDLHDSKLADRTDRATQQKIEDVAVEFVATLSNQMVTSNLGFITVAIADSNPAIASRVQSRSQSNHLLDRLAIAHAGTGNEYSEALQILEMEHRRVEHLIVVSTRPKPQSFESLPDRRATPVFWRSLLWLDASNGDLTKFFAQAE